MIDTFSSADDVLRQFLAVVSYFLPRALAFMWFFPLFTKGASSNFIKMSIGSVLVLYPAFAATSHYEAAIATPAFGVFTFVSEVMLGTILGLTIAMPYYAFKSFGALIDVYRGATFAAQVSGNDSGEELPLEQLFGYMFAALILAGPGLHAITVHLLNSYLLMPPGTIASTSFHDWVLTLLRMMADHVIFAVLLSGPILIAILVVEMSLEIISAFTQQLQVYSLQYGLRSLFGVAGLLAVMYFAEDEMLNMFRDYSESLNKLLGVIQ